MGHNVFTFYYGDAVGEFYGRSRKTEQSEKNKALLDLAKKLKSEEGLDLIFCYVYDDFLMQYTAKKIADLEIPFVNYNVDMFNQWYRQINTAQFFTKMLCAQKINMQSMERYGAKTMYFPMAAREQQEITNCSGFEPADKVTFLGTPMPFRTEVLGYLAEKNYPLAIYGKFWQENIQATPDRNKEKAISDMYHYAIPRIRCEGIGEFAKLVKNRFSNNTYRPKYNIDKQLLNGFLQHNELDCLFKKSAINLGFSRMQEDNPHLPGKNQVKLRDFEVPYAGGFYLVESAPDYDELFEIGKEVETWSDLPELEEKLRYYLEHDNEREKIAAAGQARARKDHTWRVRFEQLFDELGIKTH